MEDTETDDVTKLLSLDGLQTCSSYFEKKNIQCTYAQYTNLPASKKTDGKTYYITDKGYTIKDGVSYGDNTCHMQSDWTQAVTSADDYIRNKPTALSSFTNDEGFLTRTVNDLINYYASSQTYTKTEVEELISSIPQFQIEVVDSLLIQNPSPTTVYLLLNTTAQTANLYTEYIYVIPKTGEPYFEKLGEQTADLSGYYTSSETDNLLSNKVNTNILGAAAFKNTESGISSAQSDNLPTAKAVADYVEDHSGVLTIGTGNTDGTINVNTNGSAQDVAVKNYALKSDFSALQSTFQSDVNDVYNAIVTKGTTPQSKSLSDIVSAIGNIQTDHTSTYAPSARSADNDMGQRHSYRYVNTNNVSNSNSGTYDVTSNGVKDMGSTNDKRYISVSVSNSNSGTYTFSQNDTGGIKDMGATNDKRYVVATNVYDKGKSDGKADHSTTYTPTSRASNHDMGATHSYRYVDTRSVPNANSGTYDVTSNGLKDMGATNDKRYANINVANSNSGTYTFPANDTGGIKDLGTSNSYRYAVASNVYTKGWNDGKADHSTTYTPTSRASNNDMGATHSYRYVNTNSIPNANSGTYDVTSNGVKDMGAGNDKRYVNINVPNSNSATYTYGANDTGGTKDMGISNSYRYVNADNVYAKGKADGKADHSTTYTPTSSASNNDMGATHSYRYVNTNSVPNSNSATYGAVTSNGVKDMGATNNYRYVNINVSNSNSGTYNATSNGILDMGAANSYRYANINVQSNPYIIGAGPISSLATITFTLVAGVEYILCCAGTYANALTFTIRTDLSSSNLSSYTAGSGGTTTKQYGYKPTANGTMSIENYGTGKFAQTLWYCFMRTK